MLWLLEKFKLYSNRPAIIYHDRVFTYQDLSERITWYQNHTNISGVQPGDVVGIESAFSFDSIALLLALADRSCIVVPLVPDNNRNIGDLVEQSFLDHLFLFRNESPITGYSKRNPQKHDLILGLQQAKRAGLILFSSGTTGLPKIMLHDLTRLIESYETDKIKDINSLIVLGFDHIGGIDSLLRLLSICATITLSSALTPGDICQQIEKHKVNVLPTTPTFLNLLLISEAYRLYDLSSLQIIGFGAETISHSLLQRLKQIFPNVRLQQKFGTSETNAIRIMNDNVEEEFFRIEDAQVDYKIVDGELWLKSKNNILGYLNSELSTFEDGWFKTGDLVETKNGFLKIVGRKKEVINVGGEKVVPSTVEEVLMELPEIVDCKVYGMTNLLTGQIVAADIVVSPDTDKTLIKSIIKQHCRAKLSAFQIPIKINIVDKIELSARNKKIRS